MKRPGINRRRDELKTLYEKYGKVSHFDALQSTNRIERLLINEIKTGIFNRNVLEACNLPFVPDIIITDVPYGNMVEWEAGSGGVNQMMNALSEGCGRETVVCVCMDKKQKIQTDVYQRLEKQFVGKRKFEIYRK
ncbi:hypothetical protein HNQ56_002522 [Anaerotaenia torta]